MQTNTFYSPWGIAEGLWIATREAEIADWQGEEMESGELDRQEQERAIFDQENNYLNSFSNEV